MAGAIEGDKIFICSSFRVLEGDGKEDTLPSAEEAVERVFPDEYLVFWCPWFLTCHHSPAQGIQVSASGTPRGDLQAPPAFPALQKDVEILIFSFACCRAH